ncbi:hypothetical protein T261_4857 [Streptomyces lydicus]|nr:hypothetical protein T261_4857 [Streptomyces lydicus]
MAGHHGWRLLRCGRTGRCAAFRTENQAPRHKKGNLHPTACAQESCPRPR